MQRATLEDYQDFFIATSQDLLHPTRRVWVTLTLKLGISTGNGIQYISKERARKNFEYFISRLNQRIYRFSNKKISGIGCYEVGGKSGRPHFHLCLNMPSRCSRYYFKKHIRKAWLDTDFGWQQISFDTMNIEYLTKRRTKEDVTEDFFLIGI